MKISFFELEGWEHAYLNEKLGGGGNVLEFHNRPASPADAETLRTCDVLSPFIFTQARKELLALAPQLKLIATRSTGYDHIDSAEAKRRGIAVANVPEYGSNTVAEHTFALLLALSRRIIPAYVRTRAGQFNTEGLRGFDLRGKCIGIVGTGNIGLHVIRMAASFGMRVIAYDPYPRQAIADVLGFEYVPFDTLLSGADVISLHCPATQENRHLIRAETIARMRRGVVLVNTSRGALVNTHDLLAALQSGHLRGAGLDVLDGERFIKEDSQLQTDTRREELISVIEANRLLWREDVIVTPHNAFNSEESIRRILDTTVETIRAFQQSGTVKHAVA